LLVLESIECVRSSLFSIEKSSGQSTVEPSTATLVRTTAKVTVHGNKALESTASGHVARSSDSIRSSHLRNHIDRCQGTAPRQGATRQLSCGTQPAPERSRLSATLLERARCRPSGCEGHSQPDSAPRSWFTPWRVPYPARLRVDQLQLRLPRRQEAPPAARPRCARYGSVPERGERGAESGRTCSLYQVFRSARPDFP